MKLTTIAIAAAMAVTLSAPAGAQDRGSPVIANYGAFSPAEGAGNPPDAKIRYQVVFNVTKASDDPAKVNPSLDKVARFLNLLGSRGIRPLAGDIVVIVHGPATAIVANDKAYAAKAKGAHNANLDLIAKLRAAGVTVAVCSQALHGNGIENDQVAPGVEIDVSALTTLATLQLRGWALIPD